MANKITSWPGEYPNMGPCASNHNIKHSARIRIIKDDYGNYPYHFRANVEDKEYDGFRVRGGYYVCVPDDWHYYARLRYCERVERKKTVVLINRENNKVKENNNG